MIAGQAVAFRSLIEAVEPLARFRERVRAAPQGIDERFALLSVSALLRGEGHWIGPEQIALFREMRIGGEADIRPLTRAAWAVRRLLRADQPRHGRAGGAEGPGRGVR